MEVHAMDSQQGSQQGYLPSLLKQNPWQNLTLDEVANQLAELGKPVGSMNLDELLKGAWSVETNQVCNMDGNPGQPSLSLARSLSDKTVDELWRGIQEGEMKMGVSHMKTEEESALGEMTLEDFLVKAATFAEGLDPLKNSQSISPATCDNLNGSQSESSLIGRKRDDIGTLDKIHERRLRRKIKNRESAARSRARKQAYQNELVNKVSHLEKKNLALKKELEVDSVLWRGSLPEPRYQLRRTSSALF